MIGLSNFGVLQNKLDDNGRPIHGADGKIVKKKVQMIDAMFNKHSQPLYFANDEHLDHAASIFKGMVRILEKHRHCDI